MSYVPGTIPNGVLIQMPSTEGVNGQALVRTGIAGGIVQTGWSASAGVTDHTALSNLAWSNSGHTGTADTLAAFSGAGAATHVALSSLEQVANKGQANGYASLDGSGQIPAAQIPSIAVTEFLGSVANQTAMLALSGEKGDWCVRSDSGSNWVITGDDPSLIGNWTELSYPASPVTSVAGRTGDVTLSYADVSGLGTAAQSNAGDFATAAHNHSGVYQPLDADLTALAALSGTDVIYYRSAADTWSSVTIGSGLTFASGTLSAAGGSANAHEVNSFKNQITVRFDLLNASAGGTGSGTGNALTSRRSFTSSGTTAGSSYCRSVHNQEALGLSPGSNADVINWSNRVSLSVIISPIGETTNGVDRVYLGGDDVTTAQDIPAKGIGIHRKHDAIYGVCRNGGALIEVDLSVTLAVSAPKACAITCDSDGSGNVNWYADGVQVGTSAAGPTGDSTATQCCFHQSSSNHADAATQACFVHDAVAVLDV